MNSLTQMLINKGLPPTQALRVSVGSDQMRASGGDLETMAKREGPREGEGRAAKRLQENVILSFS